MGVGVTHGHALFTSCFPFEGDGVAGCIVTYQRSTRIGPCVAGHVGFSAQRDFTVGAHCIVARDGRLRVVVHRQRHTHDTVATVGGLVFHQLGAGFGEDSISMLRIVTVGEGAGAARHLFGGGDGWCLGDSHRRSACTAHVVGHNHCIGAGGKAGDVGAAVFKGRVTFAPCIGIRCGLHSSDFQRGGNSTVVATMAGYVRGGGGDGDLVVTVCVGDNDFSSGDAALVGIRYHKGVGAG